MSIAVIIPCYNAEPYLAQTIAGVVAQTETGWELIVVDDGSRDGSAAVARDWAARDPRVRLVQQANAGVSAARNRGAAEAGSDLLAFLDADDVWEPDALAALGAALRAQPDAVAAHGLSRQLTDGPPDDEHCYLVGLGRNRRVLGAGALPPDRPTTFEALLLENCIVTPGQVLIRRAAFQEAGPFDTTVSPAEDWDMWLRLSRLGVLAYVDRVLLNYRVHPNGASQNKNVMREATRRVRRKITDSYRDDPRRRRLVLIGVAWQNCRDKAGYLWNHLARREFRPAARQVPAILGSFARCVQAYVRP